jgi:aldehyde dehydrogenase (NAD+)
MNRFKKLFDSQKSYFDSNVTKTHEWRVEQLDRMQKMLTENEARFYDAVSQDFKTALPEKVFEVAATLGTIAGTKVQLKDWMTPVEAVIPQFLAKSGHRGTIYREPYGVTLVVCPFNGPLTLSLRPAIAALSAGNTVVFKLSEAIAATSDLLMELVPKYFEPEAVSAVRGNREEVAELLKLPFDFIFFTGSEHVGKIVACAAAENLTPILLELGGQNPVIVDETADLADAARKIVWGATAWGGHWCTSPGYAYVHESVADPFIAECKKAVVAFYGEDPSGNPDLSKVISPAEVNRLVSLIDPKLVVSGGRSNAAERYLEPTILFPVTWEDHVMEGEVFGPILPVMTYSSLDAAFLNIKKRAKPLAAYVFSKHQANIAKFLQELSFGGGAVNQTNIHLYIETMPFGGVGNSGIGHYYGKYGFDSLTHAKSILISPPDVAIEHLFPPFTMDKVEALAQWGQY